eukprot:scaffold1673_cov167-Chaetoceros_neogracile.AAC.5
MNVPLGLERIPWEDSERGIFIRGSSTAASFMKRLDRGLYPHETSTKDNKTRSKCETAVVGV